MNIKEDTNKELADAIHYPECWDTAAYPTLASALWEMIDQKELGECPTCGEEQGLIEKTSLRKELVKRGQMNPELDAQLKEIEKS